MGWARGWPCASTGRKLLKFVGVGGVGGVGVGGLGGWVRTPTFPSTRGRSKMLIDRTVGFGE